MNQQLVVEAHDDSGAETDDNPCDGRINGTKSRHEQLSYQVAVLFTFVSDSQDAGRNA